MKVVGYYCPVCKNLVSLRCGPDQCRAWCTNCAQTIVVKTHDLCFSCGDRVSCLGVPRAIKKFFPSVAAVTRKP